MSTINACSRDRVVGVRCDPRLVRPSPLSACRRVPGTRPDIQLLSDLPRYGYGFDTRTRPVFALHLQSTEWSCERDIYLLLLYGHRWLEYKHTATRWRCCEHDVIRHLTALSQSTSCTQPASVSILFPENCAIIGFIYSSCTKIGSQPSLDAPTGHVREEKTGNEMIESQTKIGRCRYVC